MIFLAHIFDAFSVHIPAFITIGSFLFLSFLGLCGVRYLFNTETLKVSHDVAAAAYNTLGVLYAVLVAFVFIEVDNRHNQTYRTIENEASLLGDLYRDAQVFPQEQRDRIRGSLKNYAIYMSQTKQDEMTGPSQNRSSFSIVESIWNAFYTLEPQSKKEEIWYQESIEKLNSFNLIRVQRLISSKESLGSILWSMLICGGFLTTFALALFYVNNFKLHVLITMLLGSVISFILFVIFVFDNPLTGNLDFRPEIFSELLQLFDRVK